MYAGTYAPGPAADFNLGETIAEIDAQRAAILRQLQINRTEITRLEQTRVNPAVIDVLRKANASLLQTLDVLTRKANGMELTAADKAVLAAGTAIGRTPGLLGGAFAATLKPLIVPGLIALGLLYFWKR